MCIGAAEAEKLQLQAAIALSLVEAEAQEARDSAAAIADVARAEGAAQRAQGRRGGAIARAAAARRLPPVVEVSETETSCRLALPSPEPEAEANAGGAAGQAEDPPVVGPQAPTARRDLANLPQRYRAYAVWSSPAGLRGVAVCAEPGAWARFSERVLLGPLAGSGAQIRRAPTAAAAAELYTRNAARHGVPLAPTLWDV